MPYTTASKISFCFHEPAAPTNRRSPETRHPQYKYVVYYAVDDKAAETVILNVKHPAQKREHGDA